MAGGSERGWSPERVVEELRKRKTELLVLGNVVFAGAAVYYWAAPRGGVVAALMDQAYSLATSVPGVSGMVSGELEEQLKSMEEDIRGDVKEEDRVLQMPASTPLEIVATKIRESARIDMAKWKPGRVSGAVYHGGDELSKIISEAVGLYCLSNPLHPETFPTSRKMDAEVVAMVLDVFNATEECCGTTTSGGTESILMACLAYREMGKKKGITRPNMVVPSTVHAAFDKGCHYFGIEMRHVEVDPVTYKAVPAAMEAACDGNTVMIVGSAPCYPQGVIDPIEELGQIALKRGIPMHVDSCLGSFIIAFAEKVGFDVPKADFRVPGVTSISCDTHKYGYGPKGCSVIMYKTPEIRKHQFFMAPDWSGGIYASPTIAGSRTGAPVAGTWATMVHLGKDGYREAATRIITAARKIKAAIETMEGIEVAGDPLLSVVAFQAASTGPVKLNPFKVSDALSKTKGWLLNALQSPPSVHIAVTMANVHRADELIEDLRAACALVKEHPDEYAGGAVAIYGSKATAPPAAVKDLVSGFLSLLYKA